MIQETKDQLEALIGNTYIYKNKTITIKSYKDINGTIAILTDKQTITKYNTEIKKFVSELKYIKSNVLEKPTSHLPVKKQNISVSYSFQKSEIHTKLENAISDMIDKVQGNKEAIPQAKALCDLANATVNIEKQQLNFLKATNQI